MAPQREWLEKDYYATLGVADTATAKEVTSAYRKLARKNHPDANPGDTAAEERFKEISAAYDVIGDETKRAEYDEVRKLAATGGFDPRGFGADFSSGDFSGMGDIGDLLGGLFNRGGGGRRASRPPAVDQETDIHISLLDALRGVTTSLTLRAAAQCPECAGSGAALGTRPRTCEVCQGSGVTQDNQGMFGFSRPCNNCHGRGAVIDSPCPTCSGQGTVSRPEEVRLKIPAGIEDGKMLRVSGRGGQAADGRRGDLYVRVHIDPHPRFSRDGRDMFTSVPITFTEAALGSDIAVPTLEGDHVTIRIPAGTKSGRKFRIKARGMPHKSGNGDLYVTTDVIVPTTLNDEQRSALEAFAEVYHENPRSNL